MSNKQLRILRYIQKYKYLHKILDKLGYSLDEYLEFQENFPDGSMDYMIFSDHDFDKNTTVALTHKAKALVGSDNRERIRTILPILSLIIAVAAFVKSFFF